MTAQDRRVSKQINDLRKAAGHPMTECPTCGRSPDNPYRRYYHDKVTQSPVAQRPRSAGQTGSTCSGVMYKDNRHSDLMQHFRGFLSGPNRCPGCAGHGITDRGTTCKACLGDGKLTSAVRGRVEWFGGARLPEPDAPLQRAPDGGAGVNGCVKGAM